MLDEIQQIIETNSVPSYCEARYHKRFDQKVSISKGELETASVDEQEGVCFRVIVGGVWGFSSTAKLDRNGMTQSLSDAISSARASNASRKIGTSGLADANLARGRFSPPINGALDEIEIEDKISLVRETEEETRKHLPIIKSASAAYKERIDLKIIVTSDGAAAEIIDSKPEFRVMAIVHDDSGMVSATESIGVTGGWHDLFSKSDSSALAHLAAEKAAKLAKAKQPKGEKGSVILDPAMVGLLSHEAIGHTVEADFVLSGSIVKGMLGNKVASDLVTLVDSGPSQIVDRAGGTIIVDDEGVIAERTAIIEKGVLKSYLHNRESAAVFSTIPTGNARAYEYNDEPLIRMRNTYIESGDWDVEEMIKDTRHGYLLKGARSGQADSNGEFMFGAQESYLIENGEITDLLRGVTVSGQAYEVLKTIDALGKDFEYDIGSGYCGKGQLAKVDGGGPHLRCQAVLGGSQ